MDKNWSTVQDGTNGKKQLCYIIIIICCICTYTLVNWVFFFCSSYKKLPVST